MVRTTLECVEQSVSGEWLLRVSRVPLATVIGLWSSGKTPEKIVAELPNAAIAELYGAIAFYLQNRDALDRDFREAQKRPATPALSEVQRRGLSDLLQTVYDALSEGGGKPSASHIERINELIAHYRLPYQHYRESINTAFAHWYREHPHKSRFGSLSGPFDRPAAPPPHAEDPPLLTPEQRCELRDLVMQILDRTNGNPADEDALAVDSFCRQLQLLPEQARHLVAGFTSNWHQGKSSRS